MALSTTQTIGAYAPGSIAARPTVKKGGVRMRDESPEAFRARMDERAASNQPAPQAVAPMRQDRIIAARADGTFAAKREAYNTDPGNVAKGLYLDEAGNPAPPPQTPAAQTPVMAAPPMAAKPRRMPSQAPAPTAGVVETPIGPMNQTPTGLQPVPAGNPLGPLGPMARPPTGLTPPVTRNVTAPVTPSVTPSVTRNAPPSAINVVTPPVTNATVTPKPLAAKPVRPVPSATPPRLNAAEAQARKNPQGIAARLNPPGAAPIPLAQDPIAKPFIAAGQAAGDALKSAGTQIKSGIQSRAAAYPQGIAAKVGKLFGMNPDRPIASRPSLVLGR